MSLLTRRGRCPPGDPAVLPTCRNPSEPWRCRPERPAEESGHRHQDGRSSTGRVASGFPEDETRRPVARGRLVPRRARAPPANGTRLVPWGTTLGHRPVRSQSNPGQWTEAKARIEPIPPMISAPTPTSFMWREEASALKVGTRSRADALGPSMEASMAGIMRRPTPPQRQRVEADRHRRPIA